MFVSVERRRGLRSGSMPKRRDDEREKTRARLARTIVWLVVALVLATMVLVFFRHLLGIDGEALKMLAGVTLPTFGLAYLAFRFYYGKQ